MYVGIEKNINVYNYVLNKLFFLFARAPTRTDDRIVDNNGKAIYSLISTAVRNIHLKLHAMFIDN